MLERKEATINDLFFSYFCSHYGEITQLGKRKGDIRKVYEEVYREYSLFYEPLLPSNKDAIILDVGCGVGYFLFTMEKLGYSRVEGIDLSPEMIAFIKETGLLQHAKLFISDAFEFLSRKNNVYDVIHMRDLIEHIPKDSVLQLLELSFQALRPSGRLILSTTNACGPAPVVICSRYMDFTHQGIFTEFSISQILRHAGFVNVRVLPTQLKFKDLNFKGKIHRALFMLPDEFMRRLYYRLSGIRPVPKVLHWHITAVGDKSPEC